MNKYVINKRVVKRGFPSVLAGLFIFASIASFVTAPSRDTEALSGSQFNAGYIVSDEVFYNSGSMSASQIQSFLNAKVPVCDTNGDQTLYDSAYGDTVTRKVYAQRRGVSTPFICLKNYKQDTPFRDGVSEQCGALTAKTNRSAANIINDVAKACGVSPKVLLVLIQKESYGPLITDDWPWPFQYETPTGYGCPDTAPCDSQYYGFFNQVYQAAKAFKRYRANPTNYNYQAGRNNTILWNPNTACGTSTVYIQNQATAGLYTYTPYRPNQAALDNYPGTGNSCSSYGNRNFWFKYNEWFGSTTTTDNIVPVIYDNSTDTTGELATIGFKLTSKPKSSVHFLIKYDSKYVSSAEYRMTIHPNDWNNPKKNLVILKGKDTLGLEGSETFELKVGSLSSYDTKFNLTHDYTPDVPIIHKDLTNEVYRLFNPSLNAHIFTGSGSERDSLTDEGWNYEGIAFYGCEAGNKVIARLNKTNNYKLLEYGSEEYYAHLNNDFTFESLVTTVSSQATKTLYAKYRPSTGSMFYTLGETTGDSSGFITIHTIKVCDKNITPVFRLYNSTVGNHFYTRSPSERNSARERHGFRYEGVGFYVTDGGTKPVHRLYSGLQGNHFYTASESEKDSAANHGFKYEGVAFYLNESDNTNVYRLFSGLQGNHFYTASESEKDSAVNGGFRNEGIGFDVY